MSGSTSDANVGGAADTSVEGSTDIDNTGNNATDRKNSNDSTINRRTGNRIGQGSRSNPMVDTTNKAFKVAETYIGCVLGLRFEKVYKKVSEDVFCNKFAHYICRTMKYRNKVVCSVNEYKDPMTYYEGNNMPKDLPTVENSAVRKEILDQKVKFYVTKEAEIKDKICNMYEKIWGQCTDALKIMIASEKLYKEK